MNHAEYCLKLQCSSLASGRHSCSEGRPALIN
jgi:hypothetical protein